MPQGIVRPAALVRVRYAVFDCNDDDLLESGEVAYRHGRGSLRRSIEAALTGLSVGETTEVFIAPSNGHREPGVIVTVPTEELAEHYRVGATVRRQSRDGRVDFVVTRLDGGGDGVALAGSRLRVVMRVVEVHAPSSAARARGGRRSPKVPDLSRLA